LSYRLGMTNLFFFSVSFCLHCISQTRSIFWFYCIFVQIITIIIKHSTKI
jgi:hypothetical protein